MSEPMYRLNRNRTRTQLCFKILLHIYDNRVAFNKDTPIYARDGGLYYLMRTPDPTLKQALADLKDKALIRQYEDDHHGLLYASITPKGIQMIEGSAKVMMAFFT